ncbi:MAG: IS110 family transposase [Vicinamibacterales bacterium]
MGKLGTDRIVVCYEAGPCGYDPYRILTKLGVRTEVIAPSLIPRRPGDRVKTGRLDARNLARLHRAGELTAIRVPTKLEEAIRDLVRVREDITEDRRSAIVRTKAFLLRRGIRSPKGWHTGHDNWARGLRFDQPAAQEAFDALLGAVQTRDVQLRSLDAKIAEWSIREPLASPVATLRALRGIDTLSAATLAAEVCDFRAFATAPAFMGFTGLVPSEHSSGAKTRRGSITKAGNQHVRRVLVEAAWSYRYRPAVGYELRRRQQNQPQAVIPHSWVAQHRLDAKFVKVAATHDRNVAVVAVARELAGFVWALMTQRYATEN